MNGAVEPDWSSLRGMAMAVERLTQAGPPLLGSTMDQASAALRDELDAIGIPVTDPDAVYTVLITATWMLGRAKQATDAGLMCEGSWRVLDGIHTGLIAMLLPHIPAEARS